MKDEARVLTRAPSLAVLYPRALLKRGHGGELPSTRLALRDVRVDPGRLADYGRVCGFGSGASLPGTYPHVLAFPLAIALMSERSFPFPLPGIVHIGNTITQLRPIAPTEALSFEVRAENLRPHRRGRQFDVVTEARLGGELVWHGTATYLRRGASDDRADHHRADVMWRSQRPPIPPYDVNDRADAAAGGGTDPSDGAGGSADHRGRDRGDCGAGGDPANSDRVKSTPVMKGSDDGAAPTAVWRVPGSIGRAYASASGDRNPIHLHPLTARLFGFPRAIAHGMWVKARCLAALGGRVPDSYVLDVQFGKPVLLPSTVDFGARSRPDGWDLSVASNGRSHLTGRLQAGG